jgi:hypothetical protein
MNRTFFFFLTSLCLLFLALACKHTPDVVVPVVTPPVSTTTTTPPASTTTAPATSTTATTTPISFSFGEGPDPVNLANCRVIQQVTKLGLASFSRPYENFIDIETVVVGGESYTVVSDSKTAYQYDQQGRLAQETQMKYLRNIRTNIQKVDTSSTNYTYQPGFVTLTGNNGSATTYPLNEQGFVSDDGGYRYTYNAEGFLIEKKNKGSFLNVQYTVENGNTIKTVYYDYGTWTDNYTYNLVQKNTVINFGLYGRPDRNIRTKHNIVTQNVSPEYAPNGEIRKDDIYTEFDKYGRVKRTIQINTFQADYTHTPLGPYLKVVDYQYACP